MIIKNGLVFTENAVFERLTVVTENGVITKIVNEERATDTDNSHGAMNDFFGCNSIPGEIIDASGYYVIPGLTDIHFHGCKGHDFSDATIASMDAIATFEFSCGVTSICPATMTLPEERISAICQTAASYQHLQETFKGDNPRSDLVGIHLEGPFLNPHKKGAQNEAYLQMPESTKLRSWQQDAKGLMRLVSLAPELPGAINCIKACRDDFHFSIAHTEANYHTAMMAFAAGADHVTHLYNAMPPMNHREPGVIGAAADTPQCYVELICDGIHVDPSVVRATFRLFGDDHVILISDSMEATGQPDGDYSLGGLKVHVNGNHATLEDGTLAGSVTSLYHCMLHAVSMGIPLESAVKAATINPCRSIGMDTQYGSLKEGKKAHMLLLSQDTLSLKAIIKDERGWRI